MSDIDLVVNQPEHALNMLDELCFTSIDANMSSTFEAANTYLTMFTYIVNGDINLAPGKNGMFFSSDKGNAERSYKGFFSVNGGFISINWRTISGKLADAFVESIWEIHNPKRLDIETIWDLMPSLPDGKTFGRYDSPIPLQINVLSWMLNHINPRGTACLNVTLNNDIKLSTHHSCDLNIPAHAIRSHYCNYDGELPDPNFIPYTVTHDEHGKTTLRTIPGESECIDVSYLNEGTDDEEVYTTKLTVTAEHSCCFPSRKHRSYHSDIDLLCIPIISDEVQ